MSTKTVGQTNAQTPRSGAVNVNFVGAPDSCPICHFSQVPTYVTDRMAQWDGEGDSENAVFLRVNQCTNGACEEVFVSRFRRQKGDGRFKYESCWPARALPTPYSDEIRSLSPAFVKIHNQALEAESYRLDELTGVGLRKALEFLVKDFAKHMHPTEHQAIESSLLGKCIDKYVDDPNLKSAAKRAAWLGNDETHYVRLWTDKDIADLKALVRIAVSVAETVLFREKYECEMPE